MADVEQNLESLLERSSGTDVPLLLKAKEDAKRRVKDDPSSANLAALDRATQMLRDAMSKQNGGNFGSVKDVLAYLVEQGRKASQSQIYKDLKRGYLRRQADGSFRQRDVDMYASTLQAYALPEKEADAMSDLARQELEEKVAKTREQRLAIAFDRKVKAGKYILREDVALELASRASALDVGLRSVFRLYVADYIRMVGGDVTKAEALAAEFDKNLDTALTEYSRPMDFALTVTPEEVTISDSGAEEREDE
ncbi:hypothetical protein [Desulfovibrio sp. ZJ200]|uniref:hypothetical protein n=1 Tax=Desulfovibrio sp. ZJ200 TaxID=2709792 RepID=UPI0013E9E2C7|nr:hypothetical protein [Desulfovibrio sp. ZJ200]